MALELLNDLQTSAGGILNLAGTTIDLQNVGLSFIKTADNCPQGISGFLFSIPMNDHIEFKSQITDHILQTNVSIQDHIALEPLRITLTGMVCELVWEKSSAKDLQYAIQVINRLQSIYALNPIQSQKAVQAIASYNSIKQQANQALQTFNTASSLITGKTSPSKQKVAYETLKNLWNERALCTVVTPWENFANMAIESLSFEQEEDSRDKTSITVSFKQIQYAEVLASKVQLKGRIQAQKSPETNQGKQQGTSLIKSLTNFAGLTPKVGG